MKPNRSLDENPIVSRWVGVSPGGRIELRSGKVELGQGATTGILQMGAAELGVDPADVDFVSGDTDRCPQEWYTAGSQSIEVGGQALRQACATARAIALHAAATALGRPLSSLGLARGRVTVDGAATDLALARVLAQADLDVPVDRTAPLQDLTGAIGRSLPRADLRERMVGAPFVHDMTLPGMLFGRVVRAPNEHAALRAVDRAALEALPGVEGVVIDGSFVGLVASSEALAWAAVERAVGQCSWSVPEIYPQAASVREMFAGQPLQDIALLDPGARAPIDGRAITLSAHYTKPAIAHASIGPSCAVAQWVDGRLLVWSHTQGVFALRDALARAFGLAPAAVRVRHVPGAGCYGHNGADDAAMDACLLARAVAGRPVKVTWSRADELSCSPCGSPMMTAIDASLEGGRIVGWHLRLWSGQHGARPGINDGVNLLAACQVAEPQPRPEPRDLPQAIGGGGDRNAVVLYDVGAQAVTYHFAGALPYRTSSMRALGAFCNVFAIESFMDELADACGEDPLAFRLRHLDDARARDVLQRAAAMAGWNGGRSVRDGRAQGLAFARYKNRAAYLAVVCELCAEEDVRVERLWACVDAGQVVNPDALVNQIEGGLVQALSWTLLERVRFSPREVLTRSWADYPILPFAMTPQIEVAVIDRPYDPPLGAGEAAQGPVPAAVANALSRAIGLRVRDLPIDRESMLATP